jgi:hypothetical protein
MRPRRLTEDARRRLNVTQGNLTALYQHPAWPTIEAEVKKKEQYIEKVLVALALHNKNGIDLEQQAYMRGFIDGMRWFTAVPASAERSLERFLRAQGVQTTVAEEVADGA